MSLEHAVGLVLSVLLWAQNRPGGGAAFRFTIPLEGAPPPGLPEPPSIAGALEERHEHRQP